MEAQINSDNLILRGCRNGGRKLKSICDEENSIYRKKVTISWIFFQN